MALKKPLCFFCIFSRVGSGGLGFVLRMREKIMPQRTHSIPSGCSKRHLGQIIVFSAMALSASALSSAASLPDFAWTLAPAKISFSLFYGSVVFRKPSLWRWLLKKATQTLRVFCFRPFRAKSSPRYAGIC
jgi:hypothetical protein